MSDAGDFIDAALQRESSWQRAEEAQGRFGPDLKCYGASVGAVRGTVRDALRRYRNLGHDDLTALSSELWSVPVFERRLAAVVLLQARVAVLDNSGVVGATTDKLLEVGQYGGQSAPQDQLGLDLRNLRKQGWQIDNVAATGESGRYRMVSGDNRLRRPIGGFAETVTAVMGSLDFS